MANAGGGRVAVAFATHLVEPGIVAAIGVLCADRVAVAEPALA
ncbi:MAG: hypothetical protein ACRDYY_03445 [Acidimicrobiales bacterium]